MSRVICWNGWDDIIECKLHSYSSLGTWESQSHAINRVYKDPGIPTVTLVCGWRSCPIHKCIGVQYPLLKRFVTGYNWLLFNIQHRLQSLCNQYRLSGGKYLITTFWLLTFSSKYCFCHGNFYIKISLKGFRITFVQKLRKSLNKYM